MSDAAASANPRASADAGAGAESRRTIPLLHVIAADDVLRRNDFERLAVELMAAGGGALALHLRAHGHGGGALYALAARLAAPARATGALLVVNDRVDVVLALAGAGAAIQLGVRSLPVGAVRRLIPSGMLVGRSTHGAEESAQAEADGADWLLLGTIYETASHPGRAGAGHALIRATVQRVSVPVIAIGGMTPERIADVVQAGAHGVAVLRGVWSAPDPREALTRYLEELKRSTQSRGPEWPPSSPR